MNKQCLVVLLLAALAVPSAHASITNVVYGDDGDGYLVCGTNWSWEMGLDTLSMSGDQYNSPGHMVGDFTTDTAEDPTLTIRNAVDNDTGFTWTGYHVNVYMSSVFTISAETVYVPNDWSLSYTIQPTLVSGGEFDGKYKGQIEYAAGTPVGVGEILDFGFTIDFSGFTSYYFCQEFVPVPEPTSLALLALGGTFLVSRRLRRN